MTDDRNDPPAGEQAANRGQVKVRWDTSDVKSSYCNVCNVTSTREEVVLNFGINQSWERSPGEVEIQLTNRVILSPFAAKRLVLTLNRLMSEYEARYGELITEAGGEGGMLKQ
jgi:hypothetical protein